MLLALVLLVVGVVSGLVRGGRLENISSVRFRQPWLVFLGLGLQVGAEAAAAAWPAIHRGITGPAILTISYALIFGFVALNRHFPGTMLIGLGLTLNLAVILANGAMPVSLWAVHAAHFPTAPHLQNALKHRVKGPGTRLGFLGDIIPIPILGIVSPGDVVLGIGVFVLVYRLMLPAPGPT